MTGKNKYPEKLEDVIGLLKGLPGIGRRSAERLALAIIKWQPEKIVSFGELLRTLPAQITFCPECGNLAETDCKCKICAATNRDHSQLCIVEDYAQISSIESSGFFHGLYHVLGGKLSPLEGHEPENLKIAPLLQRIDHAEVKEIILALSPDVEGRATAMYLADLLKNHDVKITCLAQGLPAGADLSYVDAATIGAALNGRTTLT